MDLSFIKKKEWRGSQTYMKNRDRHKRQRDIHTTIRGTAIVVIAQNNGNGEKW
jgi:hypothetical protein